MGVDHGGGDIRMAEQLLNGADVIAAQQQMGGEGVPQGVRRGRLGDVGLLHRPLEGALEGLVNQVVATQQTIAARIGRQLRLREDPEPGPCERRPRVFAVQRMRHQHAGHTGRAISRPQRLRCRQLLAQGLRQRGRQHHHPVLAALALAHHDGPALKINVLDPQPQTLQQAHAGAIEQARKKPVLIGQGRQQARHLVVRQHHRQARWALWPPDIAQPGHRQPQHLLVEKQQRRQGLPVGGRRDLALDRQPGQKGFDIGPAQVSRMAQPMEVHKGPHPVDIGLLRPDAVVQVADLPADLVQQPQRRRRRVKGHGHGHGAARGLPGACRVANRAVQIHSIHPNRSHRKPASPERQRPRATSPCGRRADSAGLA